MKKFFWRLLERWDPYYTVRGAWRSERKEIWDDFVMDCWYKVSLGTGVVAAGYAVWKSWDGGTGYASLPLRVVFAIVWSFLVFGSVSYLLGVGGVLLYLGVAKIYRFFLSGRTHMINTIKHAWQVERDPDIKLSHLGRMPFWATICIVMLAFAIPPTPSWGYVVIVHIVVSLYLLHVLVEKAYRVEKYGWTWVLGIAVGILQPVYNPLLITHPDFPMLRLSVETWSYIYVATILLLLLTIWIFPKDMKFPERPPPWESV
jgi:hypothetical protein